MNIFSVKILTVNQLKRFHNFILESIFQNSWSKHFDDHWMITTRYKIIGIVLLGNHFQSIKWTLQFESKYFEIKYCNIQIKLNAYLIWYELIVLLVFSNFHFYLTKELWCAYDIKYLFHLHNLKKKNKTIKHFTKCFRKKKKCIYIIIIKLYIKMLKLKFYNNNYKTCT